MNSPLPKAFVQVILLAVIAATTVACGSDDTDDERSAQRNSTDLTTSSIDQEVEDLLAPLEWAGDPCTLLTAEQINAPIEPGNNDYVYVFGEGEQWQNPSGAPGCQYPLVSQGEGAIQLHLAKVPPNWERAKDIYAIDEEFPGVGHDAFYALNCACLRILADDFVVAVAGSGFIGNVWELHYDDWVHDIGENLRALGHA